MLPEKVKSTMDKLCASLESRLADKLQGVYLYGSVALGDYIEGSSDIDFIAIVRHPLSQLDIQAITEAHQEVEDALPNSDIMGAYISRNDLGKSFGEMPLVLSYYNKQLHMDGKGADLNPVTWWILKNNSVCVHGLSIPFTYEITVETLTDYVIRNMNSYWVNWIKRIEEKLETPGLSDQTIPTDELDETVEWCVLGMLRQLYTIKERTVTSKAGAGIFGLDTLPSRWHELIQEAIAIKRRRTEREYASQLNRLTDLVDLLRFIHFESNRIYQESR